MRLRRELVERSIRRALEQDERAVRARSREVTAERLTEGIPPRQREYIESEVQALTGSPLRAAQAMERIIKGNDLVSINYLMLGMRAARAVCRVQLRAGPGQVMGYATGFLIGPGVLLTNHHVFETQSDAATALVDFDYELDERGRECATATYALEPARLFHADEELDYAVTAVRARSVDGKRALSEHGWLPLSVVGKKGIEGEYLTIIQHPAGERKQICVRENKLLRYMRNTLWYETDTLGGSSGSPVFNQFWQVIALHHSGVPERDEAGNWLTVSGKVYTSDMDETQVKWIANEGIRISRVVEQLQERLGDHALIRPVLSGSDPADQAPAPDHAAGVVVGEENAIRDRLAAGAGIYAELGERSASLVIPIRVPLPVLDLRAGASAGSGQEPGSGAIAGQIPAPAAPGAEPRPRPIGGSMRGAAMRGARDAVIEKVEIDTSPESYRKRNGYQPDFLGTGRLAVPLPVIPAALRRHLVTAAERTDKVKRTPELLHYWNYTIAMHKSRRMAFYSAVNIDGSARQDVGKREGDKWIDDRRIPADFQVDEQFYKKQKTFEGRELNPFDQGHLVRRLDATWGDNAAAAKEHGDDTFHYTNCAPQLWKFNQGAELWLGLEDYVLDQLEAEEAKGCVINGPVFDGPEMDERLVVDPDGERKPDPKFGGVAIPKLFWKLLVVNQGGALRAAAFVLSQERLMRQVLGKRLKDREKLTAEEARTFQVSVRDLSRLTGLGFGKLVQADSREAMGPRARTITMLSQIRFV